MNKKVAIIGLGTCIAPPAPVGKYELSFYRHDDSADDRRIYKPELHNQKRVFIKNHSKCKGTR